MATRSSALFSALADFSYRRRFPLVSFAAVLIALAASQIRSLDFEMSIVPLLEGGSEGRDAVLEYYERVPPQKYDVVCTLQFPEPMRAAELEELARFQAALEAEDQVQSLFGLADVQLVEWAGVLPSLSPLAELVGDGTLFDVVGDRPLVRNALISNDGRAAAMLVRSNFSLERDVDLDFVEWFTRRAEELRPAGSEFRLVGRGVIEQAMKRSMRSDMQRVLLWEAVVLCLLLPLLFRSVRGVVVPMAVIFAGVAGYLGLMVALDLPFSIIDTAIPGLITIIGMCDAIHMTFRFEEEYCRHHDKKRALTGMMVGVGPACVATTVTTGLGFLSLTVAQHPAVRDFGWKAALAVGMTLVAVVGLLPIGLALWPVRRTRAPWRGFRGIGYGRVRLSVGVALLVGVLAVVGATKAHVNSRWLEELTDDHPQVALLDWYEENFGGLLRVDVRVEGPLRDAEVVRALEDLQREIVQLEGVTHVESYTEWLREAAGRPEALEGARLLAAIGLLSSRTDDFPSHVVTPNWDEGRILFRTLDVGTDRYLELKDAVLEAGKELPASVQIEVGGHGELAHRNNRLVVTTMFQSFAISLITITLFIIVIFRSWRLGLISLVPNLLPVLVALGLTGWFDVPLRIGIAMIFSLGLGLAVDDSIHLLTRYREETRRAPGRPVRASITQALRSTGVALITTSLVLLVGSLCYLPSEFRSMRDVGFLLSAMVTTALVADLWLLPHMLERFGPKVAGAGPPEDDAGARPTS